jgi:hypothetical protein
MTDITDATIQLVNNIGAGLAVEFDLVDVYAISKDTFSDTALTPIYTILANSMYKIGRSWTPARTTDFLEVVKRCAIDISIVNHNGVALDMGRELSHLQAHSKTFCRQIIKNNKKITMIARVLGFGKDDPVDSKLDVHLSKRQDVTVLTGSGRIVIMGDSANKPTLVTPLPDGSSPREIFSMEAKINPKEFLKTDTIKCLGKYCLMPWYRDLCVAGSMWGLYVPPSFSLQVD